MAMQHAKPDEHTMGTDKQSIPPSAEGIASDMNLWCVEDKAQDELSALIEVHYTFYQLIDALFDSEDTRESMDWRLTQLGFTQLKDWLLIRLKRVQYLLDEEHRQVNEKLEYGGNVHTYLSALSVSMSLLSDQDRDNLLNQVASKIQTDRAEVDQFIQGLGKLEL